MQGEITIRLPENRHLLVSSTSSGVASSGGGWQCLLCDKKAATAEKLVARTCPSPRVYTITAH